MAPPSLFHRTSGGVVPTWCSPERHAVAVQLGVCDEGKGYLLAYPGNSDPMKRVCLYKDCPDDRCLKPVEHGVITMIRPPRVPRVDPNEGMVPDDPDVSLG